MRQKLIDLHEIQKIDLEIREIEKGRERLVQRLDQQAEGVKQLQTEIRTLSEQREGLVREAKTIEGTVHAEAVKLKKWEVRLNEIRNQREYLALSREVEGSKRANRESEERILELMAQREAIDKQIDALQDKLAEQDVDLSSETTSIAQQIKDADAQVATAQSRRANLLPTIPKALLSKYDAIRKKRLGIGLVLVVDGCCQGCNMRLPPQLYNILQRGDSIEQCPSCQRIVFWDHFLTDSSSGKIETDKAEATP